MNYVQCFNIGDEVVIVDNNWSHDVSYKNKCQEYIDSGEIGTVINCDGREGREVEDTWWVRVELPSRIANKHAEDVYVFVELRNLIPASEAGDGDKYEVQFVCDIHPFKNNYRANSEREALTKAEAYMINAGINCTKITVRKV